MFALTNVRLAALQQILSRLRPPISTCAIADQCHQAIFVGGQARGRPTQNTDKARPLGRPLRGWRRMISERVSKRCDKGDKPIHANAGRMLMRRGRACRTCSGYSGIWMFFVVGQNLRPRHLFDSPENRFLF